jgi:hypothetical protein
MEIKGTKWGLTLLKIVALRDNFINAMANTFV